MIKNPLFWYGNMAGAIVGWFFIVVGAFLNLHGDLHTLWLIVTLLWIVGHPLELVVAIPIAKKVGFSPQSACLKTLVFGITWWFPVKLGVFKP